MLVIKLTNNGINKAPPPNPQEVVSPDKIPNTISTKSPQHTVGRIQ